MAIEGLSRNLIEIVGRAGSLILHIGYSINLNELGGYSRSLFEL
jgi:hypothetical protein